MNRTQWLVTSEPTDVATEYVRAKLGRQIVQVYFDDNPASSTRARAP